MPIVKKETFLDIYQNRVILAKEFFRLKNHLLEEVEKLNKSNEEASRWVYEQKESLKNMKFFDSFESDRGLRS